MSSQIDKTMINRWGNSLAVRISKAIAKAAGIEKGSKIRITAKPGQIVVETVMKKPTLSEMLKAYDAQMHGGELIK